MNGLAHWTRSARGGLRFLAWLEQTNWRFGELGASARDEARRAWMRESCCRLLDVFHLPVNAYGPIPTRGVVVANHLSYLDVLVLGSHAPGTFVCKQEVASWPLIGPLLRKADTLFIDRQNPRSAAALLGTLRERARHGLVVFFPEGTTSDGSQVLPFRSALLEPWIGLEECVHPAALGYRTSRGDAGSRVCYWGDASFGPHLLHLLGRRDLEARVAFGPALEAGSDRKRLATAARASVLQLRDEWIEPWAGRPAAATPEISNASTPLCPQP